MLQKHDLVQFFIVSIVGLLRAPIAAAASNNNKKQEEVARFSTLGRSAVVVFVLYYHTYYALHYGRNVLLRTERKPKILTASRHSDEFEGINEKTKDACIKCFSR